MVSSKQWRQHWSPLGKKWQNTKRKLREYYRWSFCVFFCLHLASPTAGLDLHMLLFFFTFTKKKISACGNRLNKVNSSLAVKGNILWVSIAFSFTFTAGESEFFLFCVFFPQSKERLISSLRDGTGATGSADGVSSLEYDSVRQERDMLREELQKSKMTADNLRMELQVILFCLSVCLPVSPSVCLPAGCLSAIRLLLCLSPHLSVFCLPICLSACQLSVCLAIHPPLCLSPHLSVCLPACCLFGHSPVSVSLPITKSVCVCVCFAPFCNMGEARVHSQTWGQWGLLSREQKSSEVRFWKYGPWVLNLMQYA